ncbi:MAG TPA: LuxR C-terminal-related transcriptional regulator [Actinocrinis sp.]|nr:LuxR C-terminal-related transcriptional regulator [Actinocrinis sp.]
MSSSTLGGGTGALPADVTGFVGRRHEVAEVKRLLSTSRLVCLIGVGGVGKTRLAVRAAADLHRAFDEIRMVELADLEQPALLAQTVATAVGLQDTSGRWSVAALSDFLAGRDMLLILDNCEHVVDACAVLVDALLRGAPGLRILATSRQPLAITGEHTLTVHPLSVPHDGAPDPGGPGGLEQYEAVALFAQRAAAVVPGFAVDEHNRDAVARICRRLDGIPLAIELAAVRLRALSPHEILALLDDRYRWLTGGSRAALPRQQTLRAMVEWSYGLLSPRERVLWARLSVFGGGFDLAAAEAVCGDADLPAADLIDLLTGLVDKSLLMSERRGGRMRYWMLETIREFGLGLLLDSGRELELRRRHRDWYRRRAARAAAEWFGPGQIAWMTALRADRAQLRAALEFSLTEPDEAEYGLRMAADLLNYWLAYSLLTEGRGWIERALVAVDADCRSAGAPAPPRSPARAWGLCVGAWLALMQDDKAAAVAALDDSRALAEEPGDARTLAYVSHLSGLAALHEGDVHRAVVHLEETRRTLRAEDDLFGVVMSSLALGVALADDGAVDQAIALYEECLELTASHGETWCRLYALTVLAIERWRQGDVRRSTTLARQALLLGECFDDRLNMAVGIEVLGWAAAGEGDDTRAALLLGAADAVARSVGMSVLRIRRYIGYHEACESGLRERLGARGYERAFQAGRDHTLKQALARALGRGTGRPEPAADVRRPEAAAAGQANPAKPAGSPLTRRETEIAALVARGLSNREIAKTLVIALRTAEGHVEHILAKLGFTSRAQIAAWAARQAVASAGAAPAPANAMPDESTPKRRPRPVPSRLR